MKTFPFYHQFYSSTNSSICYLSVHLFISTCFLVGREGCKIMVVNKLMYGAGAPASIHFPLYKSCSKYINHTHLSPANLIYTLTLFIYPSYILKLYNPFFSNCPFTLLLPPPFSDSHVFHYQTFFQFFHHLLIRQSLRHAITRFERVIALMHSWFFQFFIDTPHMFHYPFQLAVLSSYLPRLFHHTHLIPEIIIFSNPSICHCYHYVIFIFLTWIYFIM